MPKSIKKTPVKKKVKKVEKVDLQFDAATRKKFKKLVPKRREFLINWIKNGYNAAQSYRDTYNPDVTPSFASTAGHQVLSHPTVKEIIAELTKSQEHELLMCKQVLIDATEATKTGVFQGEVTSSDEPDHGVRTNASMALLKLNGELVEKSEVEHNFPDSIKIDLV